MENLDDFMRKKFDTDDPVERFEFREEYWEQAQALLEAEEQRRRKRRRWLIWWIFAGFVVAVVSWQLAVGNWQLAVGSRQENGSREYSETDGQSSRQEQHSSDGATGQTFARDDIQAQGGDTASSFVSEKKMPGADSVFLKNNGKQGFGTNEGAAGKNGAPEQNTGLPKTIENQGFGTPEKNTGASPSNGRRTQKGNNSPVEKRPARPQDGITPSQNTPAPPASKSRTQAEQVGKILPTTGTQIVETSDNQPDSAKIFSNAFDDFSILPTLLALLALPTRDLDRPIATPFVRPIIPVHERKFSFSLAVSGTVSQTSPDGKRTGGTGGLAAEYRFKPNWSLGLGAQYRFLQGDWSESVDSNESTQLRYSFGYQLDEWNLKSKALHFVEIPVLVRRQLGAFNVEGGAATGFLLGVKAQVTQQHSESLKEDTETQSSIWADKSPYRPVYVAPFLGAEWQSTKHLGLSLRAHYRPGSLLKPSDASPDGGGLWWLDAGLRWHF